MPKYDPSVRAEEEAAREAAFYRENIDRIVQVAVALIGKLPGYPYSEGVINRSWQTKSQVMEDAAEMVSRIYLKGQDPF